MPPSPAPGRLTRDERAALFAERWAALRGGLAAAGADAEEWLALLRPVLVESLRRQDPIVAAWWLDAVREDLKQGR